MAIQYRKTYIPAETGKLAQTTYTAYDPEGTNTWGEQGKDLAMVTVDHRPQDRSTQTVHRWNDDTYDGVLPTHPRSYHAVRGKSGSEDTRFVEVPMMFRDYGERPHHKLSLMSSAEGHGRTAMSLMALAHQDARESGMPLVPDQHLTKASLRIVRHLSRLGMVSKSDVPKWASVASHQVMHLMDNRFGNLSNTGNYDDTGTTVSEISPADVRAARNSLAQTTRFMRQQKQSRKKQSMEGQPTLFDE